MLTVTRPARARLSESALISDQTIGMAHPNDMSGFMSSFEARRGSCSARPIVARMSEP